MKYVPNVITRTVGRTVLRTKANSPTILFVAGVVGMGTTVVLACKATMKVEGILTDHEKDMMEIGRMENRANGNLTNRQEEEFRKERQHVSLRTTSRMIRIYTPTAVAGVITIACLTTSHRQLVSRNAQLTAAYVTLQRFLESYRGRVRQEIGEEKERDVYYASTPVTLAEDTPNGPKKVYGSKPGMRSPYSQVFDDSNHNFQESSTYNEHWFRIQEDMLTNKLRAQGHLFLNEVYDRLGLPRTPTGQLCGWAIPHPESDDFVEIKFFPMHDYNGSYMLDFNAAGHVLNQAFGYGNEDL